jgi:hypothetical protein
MKLWRWVITAIVMTGLIGCTSSAQKQAEFGRGTAYGLSQFGGEAIPLSSGTYEPDLFHPQKHDTANAGQQKTENYTGTVSSARIGQGLKCEFYEDTDCKGNKAGPLGEGVYPDFREKGWPDKIKSIKCYPAG